MQAQLLSGKPIMVDYTAAADIAAGEVVVVNNSLLIAHEPIANGATGSLAAGGGVYTLTFGGTNTIAVSNGNLVRWDDTGNYAVGGTATANLKFGPNVGGNVTTNSATVTALHVSGLNI